MLKARFYAAYAYNYAGENLLAEDKCGEAIRALQESQKCESEYAHVGSQFTNNLLLTAISSYVYFLISTFHSLQILLVYIKSVQQCTKRFPKHMQGWLR